MFVVADSYILLDSWIFLHLKINKLYINKDFGVNIN